MIQGKTPYGKWEDFETFSSCMLSAYGVLTVKDFAKLWKIVFPKITLSEDQIIEQMSFSSVTTQNYKWYESQNAIADKFFSDLYSDTPISGKIQRILSGFIKNCIIQHICG